MAVTNTPRFALPHWSEGTDPHPNREGWNAILDILDDKGAIAFPSGLIGNRPASGTFGRFYLATDQGDGGRLYYDGGSGWVELNTNGGGGPGRAIVIEGTATEGTSNRSARADHTHVIPLATPTKHGAMASQWAELLENVNVGHVADSLVRRTASGSVRGSNPIHDNDLVPRQWFLDQTELLRTASGSLNGTANTLVKRGNDMGFFVPNPTHSSHAVPKSYVDGKTWDGSRITSGTVPYPRIEGSRHAYYTAWGGGGSIRTVHVTDGGEFCFYTSTERHKTNVRPYDRSIEDLLGPEPVEYDRLNPDTGELTGVHEHGFIAEKAGRFLPELVVWGRDDNGERRVDGWNYAGTVVGHQKLHRWAAGRIADLEALTASQSDQIVAQARELADLRESVQAIAQALAEGK